MRILLDPGVRDMRNKGNVVMLQAAMSRIQRLWPDAEIGVITISPHVLQLYCPGAHPVSIDDLPDWSRFGSRFDTLQQHIPGSLLKGLMEMREGTWQHWPSLKNTLITQSWFQAKNKTIEPADGSVGGGHVKGISSKAIKQTRGAEVQGADLVIVTGGGYMCDIAMEHAMSVFDRLENALELGKPTVMVGTGIGPIKDTELLARAKAIFPYVDFIAIREKIGTLPLLESFGVDLSRVMVTGDDAVEMVYSERATKLGNGIGLNLRLMSYTGVNESHIRIIRDVIQKAASLFDATLVSLPISYDLREVDVEATRLLMEGYSKVNDVNWRKFDPPMAVIRRAKHCRIVVTGAYHTAVFALAQGIPAICIAKSDAYREKLTGLAGLFQPGCEVIDINEGQLGEKLGEAIHKSWESAKSIRPALLKSAEQQIASGRAAYQHIYDLFQVKTSVQAPS